MLTYYGINPASVKGLSGDIAKWLMTGGQVLPKPIARLFIEKQFVTGRGVTSLARTLAIRNVDNGIKNGLSRGAAESIKRGAGRAILPAAVAIDASAIAMCTGNYVPDALYTIEQYDPFSDKFAHPIILPLPFKLPWER